MTLDIPGINSFGQKKNTVCRNSWFNWNVQDFKWCL